jgi:purine-cytosine permease-like protein
MASSDEPRDESVPEGESFDEALLAPGPRRSTYTPPPRFVPPADFIEAETADAPVFDPAPVAESVPTLDEPEPVAGPDPVSPTPESFPPSDYQPFAPPVFEPFTPPPLMPEPPVDAAPAEESTVFSLDDVPTGSRAFPGMPSAADYSSIFPESTEPPVIPVFPGADEEVPADWTVEPPPPPPFAAPDSDDDPFSFSRFPPPAAGSADWTTAPPPPPRIIDPNDDGDPFSFSRFSPPAAGDAWQTAPPPAPAEAFVNAPPPQAEDRDPFSFSRFPASDLSDPDLFGPPAVTSPSPEELAAALLNAPPPSVPSPVDSGPTETPAPDSAVPAPTENSAPTPVVEPEPVDEPASDTAPPVTSSVAEPADADSRTDPEPEPAASVGLDDIASTGSLPSAEEQAALLAQQASPAGAPWIPQRVSLPDDVLAEELTRTVSEPGATLDAMDILEEQLRLREEEAREYQEWEQSMLSIGTPEALATVEEVRPQFTEVVASTTSIPIQYQDSAAAGPVVEPAPVVEPVDTPESVVEPDETFDPVVEPAETVNAPSAHQDDDDGFDWNPQPLEGAEFDEETHNGDGEPIAPYVPFASFAPPLVDPLAESAEPFNPPPLIEPPASPAAPTLPEPWQVTPPVEEQPTPAPDDAAPFSPPQYSFDRPPVSPDADADAAAAAGASAPLWTPPPVAEPSAAPVVEPTPAASFDDLFVTGGAAGRSTDGVATPSPFAAPTEDPSVVAPAAAATTVAVARSPFLTEEIGAEPTPTDRRVGRAVQLFWLWFAANSSIVSVALGAILLSLGMSLRQAIIATLAGVVLSFVPLALGTLAGKRSGQPTMIVSRATFGIRGNIVPAVVAVISRIFWGGALLWLLGASVAATLVGANLTGGLSSSQLTIIGLGAGFVLALIVAFFGYNLLAKFQLVISILSFLLIVGLVAMTWQYVDLGAALEVQDGPVVLILTGAVLVFSFVGLVWANASADLARYQGASTSSAGSAAWATFGTTLPSFALIAYGSLLAASDPTIASGLVTNPIPTLGTLLPAWYPIPLIAATGLSLLSGIVVSIYSGSFALAAVGAKAKQTVTTLIVAVLVFGLGWVISSVGDVTVLFRDLATTLAVPVAAWAGIFAADVVLRRRRYDAPSLLGTGGIYPTVRWGSLAAFIVITAAGFGLTSATVDWLAWQGYIATPLGVPILDDLAGADVGVIVALVAGILVSLIGGRGAIARQEALQEATDAPK